MSPMSAYVSSLYKRCFSKDKHQIVIVKTAEDWLLAFQIMKADLDILKCVGFDCEWVTRNKHRRPVSMLQLSTLNCTALIRLHLLKHLSSLPPSLMNLLNDKTIVKVGVGVIDDQYKLLSDYEIEARGCIDLRHMAGRYKKSLAGGGLKRYADELAGIELDKSDLLRRGDWEAEELSPSMKWYAAGDSQAGLAIYMKLISFKLTCDINPESDNQVLSLLQSRAGSMCHGIKDLPYKSNPMKKSASTSDGLKVPKPATKSVSSNALRARQMYTNCIMQAPDGQVLCVCDEKKAEWYIDKGLAVRVSDQDAEDMVIRLKFEPRGRPSGERDYYRAHKENICVVCGADKSFIRKNIVPREYRKHFPQILKSHSSHDVVLMCATCHRRTGAYDQQFKEHFAKLCDAPIKFGGVAIDDDLKRVQSAARALNLNGCGNRLPDDKKDAYQRVLCDFYGTDEITEDILQTACNLYTRLPNDESPSHGFLVVKYMMARGALQDFEKQWRVRFIETLKPKFLHELWSVDYNHLKINLEPKTHGQTVVEHFLEKGAIAEFQKLWRQQFLDNFSPKYLGPHWNVDYNHLDYIWVKDDRDKAEQELLKAAQESALQSQAGIQHETRPCTP